MKRENRDPDLGFEWILQMKSKAFQSRLPIQHLSMMVQKKQPKYLGNLVYFHSFYYHHITIALKSIYLSQPLSRSRSIFLNITHLLEISIKCLTVSPKPTPSVLHKIISTTYIQFHISPFLPQSATLSSVCLFCSNPISFSLIPFHLDPFPFWIVTITALPLISSFSKSHFPLCHQIDIFQWKFRSFSFLLKII